MPFPVKNPPPLPRGNHYLDLNCYKIGFSSFKFQIDEHHTLFTLLYPNSFTSVVPVRFSSVSASIILSFTLCNIPLYDYTGIDLLVLPLMDLWDVHLSCIKLLGMFYCLVVISTHF